MNILTAENLEKSYGTKILFKNITFGIDDTDKIGLIGVNGTGKSTLLKVLAGLEPADRGHIAMGNGIRAEYLPQDPSFENGATVLEQVFKGYSPVMQLLREYEQTLYELENQAENTMLQNQLISLGQRMELENAWQLETEAKIVLTKLGIYDYKAQVNYLSGGTRKRIALASALITPADLLILDEPTNHLDPETVEWLEQYLNKRKGALLMVTHDRYFLDRVVNKTFELDRDQLYSYLGNYSVFLQGKLLRLEQERTSEDKRQNVLRNELTWIQRGAKARTTKQKARIERYQALLEQKPQAIADKIEISVGSSRLGKKVIELNRVSKCFAGRFVLKDFSYIILRNDRIGVIGPNGYGKSTFLNLIAGRFEPDQGQIDIGATVKIGYFSQENTDINDSLRVLDYIKEEAEMLPTADGTFMTASQMLERFLFSPALQWTPISKLSGGEKRRLYLLRVLMSAPNVLLLDEPTNDLDIQTLTILEQYLDEFPGAVISVSHDRYFLDRTAEKIFAFEADGRIHEFLGNYSEYLERVKEKADLQKLNSVNLQKQGAVNLGHAQRHRESGNVQEVKTKAPKFTFKEQREYELIDSMIEAAEQELKEIHNRINSAGSDYALLTELVKVQEERKRKLDQLIERWAYLNELAEEIEAYKRG